MNFLSLGKGKKKRRPTWFHIKKIHAHGKRL